METAAIRIESINATISRMRKEIKTLTAKKKKLEKELADGMRRRKLAQYRSFTIESLDPPKRPRRKPKEKEKEMADVLVKMGVQDPITAVAKLKALNARAPAKAKRPEGSRKT